MSIGKFYTVVQGDDLQLNWQIPEPSSLGLLALGGLTLLRRRRR
ncbi:MAG: PEP-CTERM sorting domain-containing protein [Planctomycetes bacterium]|nr:PEP-CTERM sorting domain-containing protein [Planctomycetota bacterium]